MSDHFVVSGSFDTATMTPEQRAVFVAEVRKLLAQSMMCVGKYGRDSEHGPIDASVHNVKLTII